MSISGIFDLEIDLSVAIRPPTTVQYILRKRQHHRFEILSSKFIILYEKRQKRKFKTLKPAQEIYISTLRRKNTKFNLLSPEKVNVSLGVWRLLQKLEKENILMDPTRLPIELDMHDCKYFIYVNLTWSRDS